MLNNNEDQPNLIAKTEHIDMTQCQIQELSRGCYFKSVTVHVLANLAIQLDIRLLCNTRGASRLKK